jgi:hypothetical protein
MIVVDTNIIGSLFLSSAQSLLAERALIKDSEWAAPILWRSELRSVLVLYMHKILSGWSTLSILWTMQWNC